MSTTSVQRNRLRGNRPAMNFIHTSVNNGGNINSNGVQPNTIIGNYGNIHANMIWYIWDQFGHYARNFPDKNWGSKLMQYILSFTQQAIDRGEIIKFDCLLFDSWSMINSDRNQDIIHSLRAWTTHEKLHVYTNGVYLDYDKMGTLKYIPLYIFITYRKSQTPFHWNTPQKSSWSPWT